MRVFAAIAASSQGGVGRVRARGSAIAGRGPRARGAARPPAMRGQRRDARHEQELRRRGVPARNPAGGVGPHHDLGLYELGLWAVLLRRELPIRATLA
jgi:hypothetical protein